LGRGRSVVSGRVSGLLEVLDRWEWGGVGSRGVWGSWKGGGEVVRDLLWGGGGGCVVGWGGWYCEEVGLMRDVGRVGRMWGREDWGGDRDAVNVRCMG